MLHSRVNTSKPNQSPKPGNTWRNPQKGLCRNGSIYNKIKPSKHCGNRCSIPPANQTKPKNTGIDGAIPKKSTKTPRKFVLHSLKARAANPTKTQKCRRWCDGATPNLETFQRFCMVARGSNIKNKHQTSWFQVGWHNQLSIGAMRWYEVSRPFEVSKFQKSAPSLRALS